MIKFRISFFGDIIRNELWLSSSKLVSSKLYYLVDGFLCCKICPYNFPRSHAVCISLCHSAWAGGCCHCFLFTEQNDCVGSNAWYSVSQTGTGNTYMIAIRWEIKIIHQQWQFHWMSFDLIVNLKVALHPRPTHVVACDSVLHITEL